MSASDVTKRQVWVECGGRCVICNKLLLLDHLDDKGAIRAIGEVAHIAAEQANGLPIEESADVIRAYWQHLPACAVREHFERRSLAGVAKACMS